MTKEFVAPFSGKMCGSLPLRELKIKNDNRKNLRGNYLAEVYDNPLKSRW